jgi:hypothetical protein
LTCLTTRSEEGWSLSRFGPTVPEAPAAFSVWQFLQPASEKTFAPAWLSEDDEPPLSEPPQPASVKATMAMSASRPGTSRGLYPSSELALYAAPFLRLLGLLLSGRFVGEDAILARRERPAPRLRPLPRRWAARRERPLVSLLERSPRLERGPPTVIA